jgi:hypothetical protein
MKAKLDLNDHVETRDQAQFVPSRGTKFLNIIEAALADMHGRLLTYDELGEIAGQSTSTIFDWTLGANLRQLEAYIRLLERLPESKRKQVIDGVCRLMPTIYHERIAWQERQVSNCQQLLRMERGLSLVLGDENARDFFITALGHSMARIDQHRLPVCGIDARLADRFVPVDGIRSLGGTLQPEKLSGLALSAWSAIRGFRKGLVLINGVWPNLRDKHNEIREMATHCHVVIADQINAAEMRANTSPSNLSHLIIVAEQKDRINISFADMAKTSDNIK